MVQGVGSGKGFSKMMEWLLNYTLFVLGKLIRICQKNYLQELI